MLLVVFVFVFLRRGGNDSAATATGNVVNIYPSATQPVKGDAQ
jgi:hypothetical protein